MGNEEEGQEERRTGHMQDAGKGDIHLVTVPRDYC